MKIWWNKEPIIYEIKRITENVIGLKVITTSPLSAAAFARHFEIHFTKEFDGKIKDEDKIVLTGEGAAVILGIGTSKERMNWWYEELIKFMQELPNKEITLEGKSKFYEVELSKRGKNRKKLFKQS